MLKYETASPLNLTKMKELKDSGLYSIPIGVGDTYKKYGGRIELWSMDGFDVITVGFQFKIIGSVTAEHIDFDPEPFLVDTGKYMDGNLYWCYGDESEKYAWADIAFRSLLTANDVHFVNPYGEKPSISNERKRQEKCIGYSDYGLARTIVREETEKWQQAESKLVEKILILKPL